MKRDDYTPGPARGTRVDKQGGTWTLIVVRELRHPPELVWAALTEPAQLAEWAPFNASRNLATPGPAELVTVGAPQAPTDGTVKRAIAPKLLEYVWGGNAMRWELEPHDGGTRLTLWHNIDERFVSWGAAGWQICLDVLEHFLVGTPLGRIVGPEVMKLEGWQRLQKEFAAQFAAD